MVAAEEIFILLNIGDLLPQSWTKPLKIFYWLAAEKFALNIIENIDSHKFL